MKPENLNPEYHGYTRWMPDARQLSQRFKDERCWGTAQDLGFDIVRSDQPLPQSVLCRWRMQLSGGSIGYCCAITNTERPETPGTRRNSFTKTRPRSFW